MLQKPENTLLFDEAFVEAATRAIENDQRVEKVQEEQKEEEKRLREEENRKQAVRMAAAAAAAEAEARRKRREEAERKREEEHARTRALDTAIAEAKERRARVIWAQTMAKYRAPNGQTLPGSTPLPQSSTSLQTSQQRQALGASQDGRAGQRHSHQVPPAVRTGNARSTTMHRTSMNMAQPPVRL